MDTRNALRTAWNEISRIRDAILVENAVTVLSGHPTAIKTIVEEDIPYEHHISARHQYLPAGFYITPPETGVSYVLVFVSGSNVRSLMYILTNGITVAFRDDTPVSGLYDTLREDNLSSIADWARLHTDVLPFTKYRVINTDHTIDEIIREDSLATLTYLLDNKMAAPQDNQPPIIKPNKKELITQLVDLIVDDASDCSSTEERLTRIEKQLKGNVNGDLSNRVKRLEEAREQDAIKYEKLANRNDKLVETLSKLQDTLNRLLEGDDV